MHSHCATTSEHVIYCNQLQAKDSIKLAIMMITIDDM